MTGIRYPVVLLGVILLAGLIPAVFAEAEEYTVSAMAGHGGSIYPSGNVKVETGGSILFTIVPAIGFEVTDVIVDGRSMGSLPTYVFSSVYQNHVITARFGKVTGSIYVESSPVGATVYLDNDPFVAGMTDEDGLVIENIEVGNHIVTFVLEGHTSEKRTVTVTAGEQTVVPPVYLTPTVPTTIPTTAPTTAPTTIPTTDPTTTPTTTPVPTTIPTTAPTTTPVPTTIPTTAPTTTPVPTTIPTTTPTTTPVPTTIPTTAPTTTPVPTTVPTTLPTTVPTTLPTTVPTQEPTTVPTTLPVTSPPSGVMDLQAITIGEDSIAWTWKDPVDPEFDQVMVSLDGLFIVNVSGGIRSFTASGLRPDTSYTIGTRTVGSSGQVNETWVNHTARTLPAAPKGALWIYTTPSRAAIAIDGTPRGYTPELLLDVAPGLRNLTLTYPGYQPKTIPVQVMAGDLIILEPITLQPEGQSAGSGKVWIYSVPSHAAITINGTPSGFTNRLLDNIPAGSVYITLTKTGYREKTLLVNVPEKSLVVLEPISLEPLLPTQENPEAAD